MSPDSPSALPRPAEMPRPPTPPPLCIADEATFWPWHDWTEFARWPDKSSTVVVVPLAGFADWGLGHALDVEETLLLGILKNAAARVDAEASFRLLTLPPLRFVAGADPGCAFAAEPPHVHQFIEEVVASVAAVGFTRIVLYNASPWNEEVIDVAARDLRIARGLQMFCVNLSGLGYDLHPTRSKTRHAAQTLATWLTGTPPEAPAAVVADPAQIWPEAEVMSPLAEPPSTLAEAQAIGPGLLAAAGAHLRSLLGEIAARPPLAHQGAIRTMRA